MCASPAAAHSHENASPAYAAEDVQEASQREAQKVYRLLNDLAKTIAEQQRAYEALVPKRQALKAEVIDLALRIEKELAPHARVSNEALVRLLDQRSAYSRLELLDSQLGALREQHVVATIEAKAPVPKQPPVSTAPGGSVIEGFCLATQDVLEAWHFRNVGRVTLDSKVEDIVVGGRARKSHGKGIRAILYAAFLLGLMRHCLRNERPHPGIAVIDSPLVAYRDADTPEGEALPAEFKHTFYKGLAEGVAEGQVIILENEDPPLELHPAITYIHFTKSSMGRYGFFPASSACSRPRPSSTYLWNSA